jgi:hypothetical protein
MLTTGCKNIFFNPSSQIAKIEQSATIGAQNLSLDKAVSLAINNTLETRLVDKLQKISIEIIKGERKNLLSSVIQAPPAGYQAKLLYLEEAFLSTITQVTPVQNDVANSIRHIIKNKIKYEELSKYSKLAFLSWKEKNATLSENEATLKLELLLELSMSTSLSTDEIKKVSLTNLPKVQKLVFPKPTAFEIDFYSRIKQNKAPLFQTAYLIYNLPDEIKKRGSGVYQPATLIDCVNRIYQYCALKVLKEQLSIAESKINNPKITPLEREKQLLNWRLNYFTTKYILSSIDIQNYSSSKESNFILDLAILLE